MHGRSRFIAALSLLVACNRDQPSRPDSGAQAASYAPVASAAPAASVLDTAMVYDAPCEGVERYAFDDPADSAFRSESRGIAQVAGAARAGAVLSIPLTSGRRLQFRTCDDERSFRLIGKGPKGRGVFLDVYFFEDYRAVWWVDDSSGTWSELPNDGAFSPDSTHVVGTIQDEYWQDEGAGAVEFYSLSARSASRTARSELGAGVEWRRPRWSNDSTVLFDRFHVTDSGPAISLGVGRARLSRGQWTLDTVPR